jgi:predicted  nucleic acid-binding Zn-ribbon protein
MTNGMPLPVAFCAVFAGRFFIVSVVGFVVSLDNLLAQQLEKLNNEIDDVGVAIQAEKKELKGFQVQLLKAETTEQKDMLREFIEKLEGSIADLKAEKIRKEEERRHLSQGLVPPPASGNFSTLRVWFCLSLVGLLLCSCFMCVFCS